MKAFAVWLLGVVLVPMVALAQAPAADVNTITGVQVSGGTVTITGTKKPNFTTFTMTDPPRLVIDISEAVFSGVPEESQVGNGTVTGIRTASYGSDASAIARVLIGYEREVETDIQANGNQLIVKVAGGGGQAVAQAQPEAAQPEAAAQ
ncbi:AMIN domain-containing protein, partial [Pyxidicoccus sp. 3LG]